MNDKVTFRKVILKWQKVNLDDLTHISTLKGIYQIYGTSPIYGQNALLYIGQSARRGDGIDDHYKNDGHIARQPDKSALFTELEEKDWDLLDVVEKTLITLLKPSGHRPCMKAGHFQVENLL